MIARQRVETAALLLAVFVAGGLAGAALERRSDDRADPGDRRTAEAPRFREPSDRIPRYLESIGLSDEQRVEIQAILDAARPETDSILSVAMPRLREITRETREAISSVLTDEQRAELEARSERRSRRDDGDSRRRRRTPDDRDDNERTGRDRPIP